MIVNGAFRLMINYKKHQLLQGINQNVFNNVLEMWENELTSLLHEGEEVIQKLFPLRVIAYLV